MHDPELCNCGQGAGATANLKTDQWENGRLLRISGMSDAHVYSFICRVLRSSRCRTSFRFSSAKPLRPTKNGQLLNVLVERSGLRFAQFTAPPATKFLRGETLSNADERSGPLWVGK